MKKILVITDSISMPREGLPYEDTWICLVKEKYPLCDFIDRSARGTTSMRLVNEGGGGVDLLESYEPDAVILQFGTAECAPRLFRKNGLEHFVMNRIMPRGPRERYIRYVKKTRTRNPALADVPPAVFEMNLRSYLTRAESIPAPVYAFLIPRAADLFRAKSPRIQEAIDVYNGIFLKLKEEFPFFECIEPFDEGTDVNTITTDELHINRQGNRILFNKIVPHIDHILDEQAVPSRSGEGIK